MNTGAGDAVNFTTPAATVSGLSWTSPALAAPGTWKLAVRAFDTVSGLEEANVDCAVTVVLNASAQDVTGQPAAPVGLRAFSLAGGSVRLEWFYPVVNRAKVATGFHVYTGSGAPNYSTPIQTVAFASGIANAFATTLTGLADGAVLTIGVRAFNATAEETNTMTVNVTADATGPSAVDSLTGTATP